MARPQPIDKRRNALVSSEPEENPADARSGGTTPNQGSLTGVHPPVVRMRLWLETDGGMFFGTGRGMLLESVDRLGSLRQAAEHLGMSYRAAWGKVRRTEKVLGVQLIEQTGGRKGGHVLTPAGRLLMEKFREWYDLVERTAVDAARELFPWTCLSFSQAHGRPDQGGDEEEAAP